jgi:nucleoside-diphosphate-sugar epimerase
MTTFVSGSSGWIGQALTAYLQSHGHAWLAVSRQHIQTQAAFESIPVSDQPLCAIHLAGLAHLQGPQQDIDAYMQANCVHALKFAKLCQRHGVRRFVFVSTAKVIGDSTEKPANESLVPRPNDPYSQAKLAAEHALSELHQPGQFEVVIIRPPLVYGENVRANFLQLLRLADSPWPLPLLANTQRSMIYIGNLVSALAHARTAPQLAGKAWFVKDDSDYPLTQLISHLRQQFNRPNRVITIPGRLLKNATSIVATSGSRLFPTTSAKLLRMTESLQVDDSGFRASGWQAPVLGWQGLNNTAAWYHYQNHIGS